MHITNRSCGTLRFAAPPHNSNVMFQEVATINCKACNKPTIGLWKNYWCSSKRPIRCSNCNLQWYREDSVTSLIGNWVLVFSPYIAFYIYLKLGSDALIAVLTLFFLIWMIGRAVESHFVSLKPFTLEVAESKYCKSRNGLVIIVAILVLIFTVGVFYK